MHKNVNEVFTDENGFFTLFNSIDSSLFVSLFGLLTNEEIEIYNEFFLFRYGEYKIYKDYMTPEKLVNFCILRCKDSWLGYKDVISSDYKFGSKSFIETRQVEVNAYDNTDLTLSDKETIEHKENGDKEIEVAQSGIDFNKNNNLIDLILYDVSDTILMGV